MGIYAVDVNRQNIKPLIKREFKKIGIKEKDIQDVVKNNPDILGEPLFVIGEELNLCQETQKHLDVLAIDKEGKIVVIEFKRDTDGFHMDLQAIRYASMARLLTIEKLIEYRSEFIQQEKDQAEQELIEFLGKEYLDKIEVNNANVRIMLVNQDFSPEITNCVIWLNEQGLDIQCVKIEPYEFNGQTLWDIDTIIPVKEVQEYQMTLREKQQSDQETKRQSNKDFSKYQFNGDEFGKGRLVLEVVTHYCKNNNVIDIADLQNKFPSTLQPRFDVVTLLSELKNNPSLMMRYFRNDNQIIALNNGDKVVVCNQWGVGNIDNFINRAKELGYVIEKVGK
ncbi:hypothetical protein [Moraxella oblonga]|uniref:hypothetical protein n=1 Tax=Moraxella oblonga TaxID=200413 RepID=UPI0008295B04|nr:hypothetical protein [Moraxella oblonga]